MTLEHLSVVHRTFGEGVVVEQNGKYFKVRFRSGDKTFVYPDAFEKFLAVPEGEIGEQIRAELSSVLAARQKIADSKTEENIRAMTKGIVIPGKEITQGEEGEEDGKLSSEAEDL